MDQHKVMTTKTDHSDGRHADASKICQDGHWSNLQFVILTTDPNNDMTIQINKIEKAHEQNELQPTGTTIPIAQHPQSSNK